MYAPWVSAVNLACRPRPEGGNPPNGQTAFKTAAFDRSATSPHKEIGH